MICNKCGYDNKPECKFCEGCGTPLTASAPIQPPAQPVAPEKKKSSAGKIVGIILGIVGGAIVVGGLLIALIIFVIFAILGKTRIDSVKVPAMQDSYSESQIGLPSVSDGNNQDADVDNSPKVETSYRIMTVTSKLGLNVRSAPNTSSPVVAVLIENRDVYVEKVENNWAYVNCGDIKGWCSLQYLREVSFYNKGKLTTAEVSKAKAEANEIIDSYMGKKVSGRTDINVSNAVAYFEACNKQYGYNNSFGEQFEGLTAIAADDNVVYYYVNDSKCKSVEDLCQRYFSQFSDDVAAACLRDKVMMIDGKLTVAFRSKYYSGYHISNTFNVKQVASDRIDITVAVKKYDEDLLTHDKNGKATANSPIITVNNTYTCMIEDGVWVFANMDVLYE